MDDRAYVDSQYHTETNLASRASVWRSGGQQPLEVAVQAILDARPRRVVEVGCGEGQLAERIAAETGALVVATDRSRRMAEIAGGRSRPSLVADVQALPFAQSEFDCAVAAWMLYHVPNLDRGIAELARVVRPGGVLVAVTNGTDHLHELWTLVQRDPVPLKFNRSNGAALLRAHFHRVEQHDLTTTATFSSRAQVVRYLASLEDGRSLVQDLPEFVSPFESFGRPTVFVARR